MHRDQAAFGKFGLVQVSRDQRQPHAMDRALNQRGELVAHGEAMVEFPAEITA